MDVVARARIPNLLTLSRVGLAGVFFALLSLRPSTRVGMDWPQGGNGEGVDLWLVAAAAIFIIAAITDALDGYLARKWNAVSTFGRIMDPFADKVLVLGAFVYLAGPAFTQTITLEPGTTSGMAAETTMRFQASGVAVWMVVVIIARELLVTSIRGAFEAQGIDFSAGWAGKAKMVLQSVAVPLILLILAFAKPGLFYETAPLRWVIDGVVWATVIVTVWSGLPYIRRAVRASPPLPLGEEMSARREVREAGRGGPSGLSQPQDPHPSPLPKGEGAKTAPPSPPRP